LETLAAKRQQFIDLQKQDMDQILTKLTSTDALERRTAFKSAMSSLEDTILLDRVFTTAFKSGYDDLKGLALEHYIARMPQIIMTIKWNDKNKSVFSYPFNIKEFEGKTFLWELDFPRRRPYGRGLIQGNALVLTGSYHWNTRVDDQGTLSGLIRSRYGNDSGIASISLSLN